MKVGKDVLDSFTRETEATEIKDPFHVYDEMTLRFKKVNSILKVLHRQVCGSRKQGFMGMCGEYALLRTVRGEVGQIESLFQFLYNEYSRLMQEHEVLSIKFSSTRGDIIHAQVGVLEAECRKKDDTIKVLKETLVKNAMDTDKDYVKSSGDSTGNDESQCGLLRELVGALAGALKTVPVESVGGQAFHELWENYGDLIKVCLEDGAVGSMWENTPGRGRTRICQLGEDTVELHEELYCGVGIVPSEKNGGQNDTVVPKSDSQGSGPQEVESLLKENEALVVELKLRDKSIEELKHRLKEVQEKYHKEVGLRQGLSEKLKGFVDAGAKHKSQTALEDEVVYLTQKVKDLEKALRDDCEEEGGRELRERVWRQCRIIDEHTETVQRLKEENLSLVLTLEKLRGGKNK